MTCNKFLRVKLASTYLVKMILVGTKEDPIESRSKLPQLA